MLIDFVVENYRSIKDAITLSAVASKGRSRSAKRKRTIRLDEEIARPYLITGRGLEILPVIGIFGPNASGKTNVVRALEDLLAFLAFGSGSSGVGTLTTLFTPFMFDKKYSSSPTRLKLRVALQGSIFEYSLVVDSSRIVEERLTHVPPHPSRMSFRLVFERVWNRKTKSATWKNGKALGGAYKEIQESLAEYEPFMHFLVKRLKVETVQPFADWVSWKWPGQVRFHTVIDNTLVPFVLDVNPELKTQVVSLIRNFDTGIDNIELEKVESGESDGNQIRVWSVHKSGRNAYRLPFNQESTGTQRLCDLSSKMLHSFDLATLMVGDELSSSIHPNITRRIIELFQSEESNPKRAQLIFTSHDNTLQRSGLLRRDQIWFTEKKPDGSTNLYPLTDFRPRNDLAVDRAYLDGRFGAVPILPHNLNQVVKPTKK